MTVTSNVFFKKCVHLNSVVKKNHQAPPYIHTVTCRECIWSSAGTKGIVLHMMWRMLNDVNSQPQFILSKLLKWLHKDDNCKVRKHTNMSSVGVQKNCNELKAMCECSAITEKNIYLCSKRWFNSHIYTWADICVKYARGIVMWKAVNPYQFCTQCHTICNRAGWWLWLYVLVFKSVC